MLWVLSKSSILHYCTDIIEVILLAYLICGSMTPLRSWSSSCSIIPGEYPGEYTVLSEILNSVIRVAWHVTEYICWLARLNWRRFGSFFFVNSVQIYQLHG